MFTMNYFPTFVPLVRDSQALQRDPFVLLDVGCSGGIGSHWRLWESNLVAHGFDPQQDEIARLQKVEKNKNVNYWSYFVGLEDSHPFHAGKRQEDEILKQYDLYWGRSSAAYASELQKTGIPLQGNPIFENETKARIGVSQFVRERNLKNVDFIKVDTDGGDLEVLLSCEEMVRPCGVLGFMIEVPFTGTDSETSNSFHNIDRLMRKHGYRLFGLIPQCYARRDLPLPFTYDMLASTNGGQAMWGDAVYFQDAASPAYRHVWPEELSVAKIVKLAGLFELHGYPDCAVELLNCYRSRLQAEIDVDALRDSLVPVFQGKKLSYEEYCKLFETQTDAFLPKNYNRSPEPQQTAPAPTTPTTAPPPVQEQRPLWRRAAGKVWRKLRRAG